MMLKGDPCRQTFFTSGTIDGERIIFNLSADGTRVSAYSEETGYVMWEKLVAMYAGGVL